MRICLRRLFPEGVGNACSLWGNACFPRVWGNQQAVDVVDVSTGTKCAHFGFGHSTCMTHVVGHSGLTQTLGLFALNVSGRRLAMRGDGVWPGLGAQDDYRGPSRAPTPGEKVTRGASKRADHVLAKRTFDQTPCPPRFERPMSVCRWGYLSDTPRPR